jgi:uncharacterized membrane protein
MTALYSEIKAGASLRRAGLRVLLSTTVVAAVGWGLRPADAEFKVCNQTLSLYNIAIGTEKEEDVFETEGWWTLSANDCVSPITDDLASRYVYVFATNIYGDDALSGETTMCIDRRKHFTITGTDNCWLRGYEAAHFKEVDTHSSSSWTIFIRENQD